MKKVGILSMQRIFNYGSFLQAFALKKIVESQGNNVQFVDYHIDSPIVDGESKNRILRSFGKIINVLKYPTNFEQKIKYLSFKRNFGRKYFPLLDVHEEKNYLPVLDVLIIGSDEVFNCIQKNINVGYSLELFGKNNKASKLISYAASFGNTKIDDLKEYGKDKEIGYFLKKFNSISVRDNNSRKIVRELTGINAEYNLDPVLIYDFSPYFENDELPNIKEKYIVLYAYSGRITKNESEWISNYAATKNLKIYSIGGLQECADEFINCSPLEIFYYFRNAEEIITDTFHGSILSIITHKKFATLVRKSNNKSYGNEEKLTDLLKNVGLSSRMSYKVEDIKKINNIDISYSKVDEIIAKRKSETFEYLKREV